MHLQPFQPQGGSYSIFTISGTVFCLRHVCYSALSMLGLGSLQRGIPCWRASECLGINLSLGMLFIYRAPVNLSLGMLFIYRAPVNPAESQG